MIIAGLIDNISSFSGGRWKRPALEVVGSNPTQGKFLFFIQIAYFLGFIDYSRFNKLFLSTNLFFFLSATIFQRNFFVANGKVCAKWGSLTLIHPFNHFSLVFPDWKISWNHSLDALSGWICRIRWMKLIYLPGWLIKCKMSTM